MPVYLSQFDSKQGVCIDPRFAFRRFRRFAGKDCIYRWRLEKCRNLRLRIFCSCLGRLKCFWRNRLGLVLIVFCASRRFPARLCARSRKGRKRRRVVRGNQSSRHTAGLRKCRGSFAFGLNRRAVCFSFRVH